MLKVYYSRLHTLKIISAGYHVKQNKITNACSAKGNKPQDLGWGALQMCAVGALGCPTW